MKRKFGDLIYIFRRYIAYMSAYYMTRSVHNNNKAYFGRVERIRVSKMNVLTVARKKQQWIKREKICNSNQKQKKKNENDNKNYDHRSV